MPLNKSERKNLSAFLRNFLANNRNSSSFDILESLEEEIPELAAKPFSKDQNVQANLAKERLFYFPKHAIQHDAIGL